MLCVLQTKITHADAKEILRTLGNEMCADCKLVRVRACVRACVC
jgi:hypothetical protein